MNKSMNRGIKPAHLKQIQKKYGLKPGEALSAKQFKELQELSLSKNKSTESFHFDYEISVTRDIDGRVEHIIITLIGKHLSKNAYDALTMKKRFSYARAIKDASKRASLLYREEIKRLSGEGVIPIRCSEVHYAFYNKRSRDHDNGFETLKKFQDTFTVLRIIEDDNRDALISKGIDEVLIGKNEKYKVVATITPIKN